MKNLTDDLQDHYCVAIYDKMYNQVLSKLDGKVELTLYQDLYRKIGGANIGELYWSIHNQIKTDVRS